MYTCTFLTYMYKGSLRLYIHVYIYIYMGGGVKGIQCTCVFPYVFVKSKV